MGQGTHVELEPGLPALGALVLLCAMGFSHAPPLECRATALQTSLCHEFLEPGSITHSPAFKREQLTLARELSYPGKMRT